MRMYDVIKKKRDGGELTSEEIAEVIDGLMSGNVPDYQVSALLMSIYYSGMSYDETLSLTLAMANSGDILKLDGIQGVKVDKHSTGGVGDKTSLVLGPLVAACGGKVAKMSGRGLGHTGGTIDKLESFNGFSTSMTEERFIEQVNDIGIAITGQTGNLAPADKKLYALRDVTATVESKALIASSIMSKKIASGADVIVLDVKTGDGAFMKTKEDAVSLAKTMVDIGEGAGRKTIALITDMSQPLGYAVGNSLEVIEAIETLRGRGPSDLEKLCIALGTYMLTNARLGYTKVTAEAALKRAISDGSALEKLREWVMAQGGDVRQVDDYSLFPQAKFVDEVRYSSYEMNCECNDYFNNEALSDAGYMSEKETVPAAAWHTGDDQNTCTSKGYDNNTIYVDNIHAECIGLASMILGGGRQKKGDSIDLSVGVVLKKKIGDEIKDGEVYAVIYGNDKEKMDRASQMVENAYVFTKKRPAAHNLIQCVVEPLL